MASVTFKWPQMGHVHLSVIFGQESTFGTVCSVADSSSQERRDSTFPTNHALKLLAGLAVLKAGEKRSRGDSSPRLAVLERGKSIAFFRLRKLLLLLCHFSR